MAGNPEQTQRSREVPKIHFHTDGWINDPCAPGYDPWTGTYHLFYQCNPAGCEWGNMSWGHAVSKDMLTWSPASVSPVLLPEQIYDSQGVFTGCWIPPTGDALDKTLRIAYSSVKHLPFHWSTPPYPRDAAGLAIAISCDGGITWEKSPINPILAGEPSGLQVTGFRDPYVTQLPAISEALGKGVTTSYGLISGGIQDLGPTTFLYEIDNNNVEKWKYLSPLVGVPARFQPSKWCGNYGVNWECTNIVTLHAGSESRNFLIIGPEGDVEKTHVKNFDQSSGVPSRTVRAQLWMSGDVTPSDNGAKFRYEHGGYLDHGPYYAANSFLDPISNRRIVYGWIPEEDIPLETAKRKGWNGSLAIPREIFLLRIPNAEKALRSKLSDIYPFETKIQLDGSTTIFTLGVKPIDEMARLREASSQVFKLDPAVMLPDTSGLAHRTLFQTKSATWELEATISIHPGCETVGFHLRHNNGLSIRTSVTFCTVTETIIVDRETSTTDSTINKCPDAGPFTLLLKRETNENSELTMEKLRLRIFSDGDILEIFANDRFALATMVYSANYTQDSSGISAFATGGMGSAVFERVTVWDGLDARNLPARANSLTGQRDPLRPS